MHCVVHTYHMVVCLHVLVCEEYLFVPCHGPRLITSADTWLYVCLLLQLLALRLFFSFIDRELVSLSPGDVFTSVFQYNNLSGHLRLLTMIMVVWSLVIAQSV